MPRITMSQGGTIEPTLELVTETNDYFMGEYPVPSALAPLADRVLWRNAPELAHVVAHTNEHGRLCFYMGMGIGKGDASPI